MILRKRSVVRSWLLLLLFLFTTVPSFAQTGGPIRIGMAPSFFVDVPTVFVDIATDPFAQVMREATGLEGKLSVGKSSFDVASDLNDEKLQLGVFHGYEFAWAQQKHPDLKPLMVAVNAYREIRVYLLVKSDAMLDSLADLKGKTLGIPKKTKDHCRIFVNRQCQDCDQCEFCKFFGKLTTPAHDHAGLDSVARGSIESVVVDTLSLESYKELKPAGYQRLRVLKQSEPMPAAVIAYRSGAVDDATLSRFRNGLMNAHNFGLGREMMKMWRVQAFEPIPTNYQQQLADVLKAYPAPSTPQRISQR